MALHQLLQKTKIGALPQKRIVQRFQRYFLFSALKHSPSKRGKRDSIKKLTVDRDALNESGSSSAPTAGSTTVPTAPALPSAASAFGASTSVTAGGSSNITQPSGNGKKSRMSLKYSLFNWEI